MELVVARRQLLGLPQSLLRGTQPLQPDEGLGEVDQEAAPLGVRQPPQLQGLLVPLDRFGQELPLMQHLGQGPQRLGIARIDLDDGPLRVHPFTHHVQDVADRVAVLPHADHGLLPLSDEGFDVVAAPENEDRALLLSSPREHLQVSPQPLPALVADVEPLELAAEPTSDLQALPSFDAGGGVPVGAALELHHPFGHENDDCAVGGDVDLELSALGDGDERLSVPPHEAGEAGGDVVPEVDQQATALQAAPSDPRLPTQPGPRAVRARHDRLIEAVRLQAHASLGGVQAEQGARFDGGARLDGPSGVALAQAGVLRAEGGGLVSE